MPNGPLRTAIEDMANASPVVIVFRRWWKVVNTRVTECQKIASGYVKQYGVHSWVHMFPTALATFGYLLTGDTGLHDLAAGAQANEGVPDFSKKIAALITAVESDPLIREISESYGALFSAPFEAFFNNYAGVEDFDVEEFMRAMHGVSATINLQAGALGAIYELLGLGQTQALDDMVSSMQQAIPARAIHSTVATPMLTAGVGGNVTRFFNRKYRPARFKASDLRDLYALGETTQAAVADGAAAEGWRDKDIDLWIKLAFRKLAQGDIFTAWYQGQIDQAGVVRRLRALGYDPDDIPILIAINPDPKATNNKDASVGDARTAYQDGVIDEAQLRGLLDEMSYSPQAINLIVEIEKAKSEVTATTLTVGEIKSAWSDNILTDQEALHWLADANVSEDAAAVLLETWRHTAAPAFRKLNSGTILDAYVHGVINRGQAKTDLLGVGFADADAELEIKLVEQRNPKVFGSATVASATRISISQLGNLLALGVITADQMTKRLVQDGYLQADALLLTQAASLKIQAAKPKLQQSLILEAYLEHILDRAGAAALLGQLDYTAKQVELILKSFEDKYPGQFGVPSKAPVHVLGSSELEQLYLAGVLKEADYRDRLVDLGFAAADVDLIVLKDKQSLAPVTRQMTELAIEQAYVAGVYDRTAAYNRLLAEDYTPEDAATRLDTIESANPAVFAPSLVQSIQTPSITVLVAALQNGVITQDQYTARAQELGYSAADAGLYAALATTNERKPSASLSLSQIQQAYEKGLMERGTALSRVMALGYANDDADLLLRMIKPGIDATDTWDSLLNGALTPINAVAALVSASYSDEDIYEAFAALGSASLEAMGVDLDLLKASLAAVPGGA